MNQQQFDVLIQAFQFLPAAMQQAMNEGRGSTSKLEPFSSNDAAEWIDWRQAFEAHAACYQWNANRGKAQFKSFLRSLALSTFNHAITAAQLGDANFTLENALDAFENRLLQGRGAETAYNAFMDAQRNPGETIANWQTRLLTLFRRAHPNVQDHENNPALLRQFLTGLRDTDLMNAIATVPLAQRNTFAALYTVAVDIEACKTTIAERARRDREAAATSTTSTSGVQAIAQRSNYNLPCYSCNETGHFIRDCPRRNDGTRGTQNNQTRYQTRGTTGQAPRTHFNQPKKGMGGRGKAKPFTIYNQRRGGGGYRGKTTNLRQAIQALLDDHKGDTNTQGASGSINSLSGGGYTHDYYDDDGQEEYAEETEQEDVYTISDDYP